VTVLEETGVVVSPAGLAAILRVTSRSPDFEALERAAGEAVAKWCMGVTFDKADPVALFEFFVAADAKREQARVDAAKAEAAAEREARRKRVEQAVADRAREAEEAAALSTPDAQAAREAMIAREAAKLAEKLGGLDVAPRAPPVHHSQGAEVVDEDEEPLSLAAPADPERAARCAAARAHLEARMCGGIPAEGAP
jgi:hypothetical protein